MALKRPRRCSAAGRVSHQLCSLALFLCIAPLHGQPLRIVSAALWSLSRPGYANRRGYATAIHAQLQSLHAEGTLHALAVTFPSELLVCSDKVSKL